MEIKQRLDVLLNEIPTCRNNKLLHKYLSSMMFEGTIFTFLGGYFSYLMIHRFSRGACFGFAVMFGYNQSLLYKAFTS